MFSRCLIAAPLAVAALAVAGCGSGPQDTSKDFSGEQQQVAAVIEKLEKTASNARPDTDKICNDLFTVALARRISDQDPKKNCPEALKDPLGDVAAAGADGFHLKVVKDGITIDGDKATAKVLNEAGDEKLTSDYGLVKGSDGWRINSF